MSESLIVWCVVSARLILRTFRSKERLGIWFFYTTINMLKVFKFFLSVTQLDVHIQVWKYHRILIPQYVSEWMNLAKATMITWYILNEESIIKTFFWNAVKPCTLGNGLVVRNRWNYLIISYLCKTNVSLIFLNFVSVGQWFKFRIIKQKLCLMIKNSSLKFYVLFLTFL